MEFLGELGEETPVRRCDDPGVGEKLAHLLFSNGVNRGHMLILLQLMEGKVNILAQIIEHRALFSLFLSLTCRGKVGGTPTGGARVEPARSVYSKKKSPLAYGGA